MKTDLPPPKLALIMLYSLSHPGGKTFPAEGTDVEDMIEKGWVDTPAKLDLPKPEPEVNLTAEQAENVTPDVLISKVKVLGYLVLTPDELKAEINKALHAEAEHVAMLQDLAEQFDEKPESLTVDQLVLVGNSLFGLSLEEKTKKADLIKAITTAASV